VVNNIFYRRGKSIDLSDPENTAKGATTVDIDPRPLLVKTGSR
jgi:hypothetical protein